MKVSNSITSIAGTVASLILAPTIHSPIQSVIHHASNHLAMPQVKPATESSPSQSIRHRQNVNDSDNKYVEINLGD